MKSISILTVIVAFSLTACAQSTSSEEKMVKKSKKTAKQLDKLQHAYFASGCFWCVEAVFESVKGVEEAISGYSGGQVLNPTYEAVCTGSTGHAEAVEVIYDSTVVSYETLVKVFFGSHDPSTLNRQGPDGGTQYRSAIFYQTSAEKEIANSYIDKLVKEQKFSKITTEVSKLTVFYKAEDYHQDYEPTHHDNPYVLNVSVPRLNKFKQAYPELLK